MAQYSPEQTDEFRSIVRSMVVRKPDLSIRQLQELLSKNPRRPVKLGKNFLGKLVKEIHARRSERIDYYTVNEVLGKFEDEVQELKEILLALIQTRDTPPMAKVVAVKEYRQSSLALIDKLFDAGIFEKKLGTLDVERKLSEEESKLLDQAIEYAFRPKQNKEDSAKSGTEEGSSGT